MMATDRIVVALPAAAAARIIEHGDLTNSPSHPATIQALLDERYGLQRAELSRIPLTEAEADCIADVMNGTFLGPGFGAGILLGELLDAFHLGAVGGSTYGDHHGIDEDALIGKLRGIGPSADLALREAFARWWKLSDEDRDYAKVGLRIVD